MAKSSSTYPDHLKPSLGHKLALKLEKVRLQQFLEISQSLPKVFSYHVWAGLATGFGFVVGASVVAVLLVALLGLLGSVLPGDVGAFVTGLNRTATEGMAR